MQFELAAMAARSGYRRQVTEFRAIKPTAAFGNELAHIYLANVAIWERAAPRIVEQYASSVSALHHDRAPAIQETIDEADAEATDKHRAAKIAAALLAFLGRYERWHRTLWISIIKRTTVDLSHFLSPHDVAPQIETALARNAALIKNISDEAAGKISDIVYRGLQSGAPASEVAAEIQGAVAFAKKRSIRVAHDQLTKASGALDEARMNQAGLTEYMWMHTPQRHPRLWHLARNGRIFKLGEPRGDEPGIAPFCRCYRVPIMRLTKKSQPSVNA
jgi:SPP1 gp7 family putative phage head morphogenesis protein